ncbi:ATP-binding protein [Streptomyces alanosinicus]|uniref:Histidine kinase/HSP90-like ATPase domain-containing protein n=1 Tax=Streptomyces alanosinicus TaxID=68171 RepID=A0A918YLB0_9ACTN|nr:ATP-binding protein [Streptomyces alanosinicus]GHE06205.1 hypothetical protein GCM10010339_45400 [Streptomyces alanosinicus]
MAPPSLPRPLPPSPEEPRLAVGALRLPAVPRQHRSAAAGPDGTPDSLEHPDRAPAEADRPHRFLDGARQSRPAGDSAEHPHRPPVTAGVRRPPGGERLGRLPGPVGPDRLASGVPPPRAAAFDLPAQPAAVSTARRVVRELLAAWGVPDGPRADAVLVTSELVTNALVHTAGDRIVCRLHDTADRTRIEVEDREGGPALPVARRPGPEDPHGRGLLLVEALSRDWGVTPIPGRPARVVWAELAPGHD